MPPGPTPFSFISSATPTVAAKRTEQGEDRPLLMGADPEQQIRKLLAEREPFYRLADYVLEAGKGPADGGGRRGRAARPPLRRMGLGDHK